MANKILDVWPIRLIPQSQDWEEFPPLSGDEKARVIERARKAGYTPESSRPLEQPRTERIRLNDPNNEGYHRDYIVRFEP